MTRSIVLDGLPDNRIYKILSALVVPRPIALVTTIDGAGVVNAAPYSFFNVICENPPLVILGLHHDAEDKPKDTGRNIRDSGEFVVNLVDEALAEAMNICAVDFPPHVSELSAAGLTPAASTTVRPPRIAEAPAALECRKEASLALSDRRDLIVGRIVQVHVRDGIMNDAFDVDVERFNPVGRLFGNLYARMTDVFRLDRISYSEWTQRNGE